MSRLQQHLLFRQRTFSTGWFYHEVLLVFGAGAKLILRPELYRLRCNRLMGRSPGPELSEHEMTGAIPRILPRASAEFVAIVDTFVSVALFSGVGLLLSLSVLILDQYIPGEWF